MILTIFSESLYGFLSTIYNVLLSGLGLWSTLNLQYGEHNRHRLDVYRPSERSDSLRPVIVFFYGGAWNSGKKEMYYFVARSFVDRGYVVVIPDYRLFPEVRYPAFVEDSAKALEWVAGNVQNYGGDPDRMFLMGHSAGAYNASMITYDDRRRTFQGTIRGFVGLAGLYDFLPITEEKIKRIFAPARKMSLTQPVRFVDPEDPPGLLLAGKDDDRVNPLNSRNMLKALHEAGLNGGFELIEGAGHLELVLSLGPYFRSLYPTLEMIDAFMREVNPGAMTQ